MAAGDTTQGRRVADDTYMGYEPGDYGLVDGVWFCKTPYPEMDYEDGPPTGLGGNLSNHQVVEHDDGTITVSPSILVWTEWGEDRVRHEWHGYLEQGVWREV